ncbi:MAG: HAMP domain-containing sensor histidine kinase [bacterium]
MKIRFRLQIITLVFIALTLLIGGVNVYVSQTLRLKADAEVTAMEIVKGVFELNVVANDFLLYDGKRPQVQWQARYESIERLFDEGGFESGEELEIVDRLRGYHADIGVIFNNLVSAQENLAELEALKSAEDVPADEETGGEFGRFVGEEVAEDSGADLRQVEDRLIGRLSVNSQAMVADAARLSDISREALVSAQQKTVIYSVSSVGIIAIVFLLSLLFVQRTMALPLAELSKGAKIIGAGDLGHRIEIKSKDEFGDLAVEFNEMTADLQKSYSELEKSVEELKELDELKDEFMNVATHELKTPLIPIRAQCDLLLAGDYGPINQEQREAADMILRNEIELETLVGEVLDITKVRSNKLNLVPEELSLAELVTEAVDGMKGAAAKQYINVELKPIPELPSISVDRRRISQVLRNLLDNAVKFTPEKGKITVEVAKDTENVIVSIADTGIGMDKITIDKLFSPFFQADSDITRRYGGTGLGLSICKGIVRAHGGKIWAESAGLNMGSKFIFVLPINSLT